MQKQEVEIRNTNGHKRTGNGELPVFTFIYLHLPSFTLIHLDLLLDWLVLAPNPVLSTVREQLTSNSLDVLRLGPGGAHTGMVSGSRPAVPKAVNIG